MTIGLLLLAILLFFISEIFGDFYPIIQDRFRVAGLFATFFLVVWVLCSISVSQSLMPDWMQNRIIIEKCRLPC